VLLPRPTSGLAAPLRLDQSVLLVGRAVAEADRSARPLLTEDDLHPSDRALGGVDEGVRVVPLLVPIVSVHLATVRPGNSRPTSRPKRQDRGNRLRDRDLHRLRPRDPCRHASQPRRRGRVRKHPGLRLRVASPGIRRMGGARHRVGSRAPVRRIARSLKISRPRDPRLARLARRACPWQRERACRSPCALLDARHSSVDTRIHH
jgi:hypothetical protein